MTEHEHEHGGDEDEIEDPIPGMIAAIDQGLAVLPQQARALYGIYTTYAEAGFEHEQAWEITMAYLYSWLSD